MNDNTIKLVDYFQISPDPSLAQLSKKEKINLIDFAVSSEENDKDRGLLITYDLSHSGRRINNRIYTAKGQRDGVHSILHPYPKPILKHHDSGADPIGRFTHAEWQDLSSLAMGSFTDISEFMELKRAFDRDDPEMIYKVMKKNHLLTDENWQGVGRMRVQARISDKDSVEKFLDGRYITFSAGSTTDRHVCSICLEDWAKGDICEHRHGRIYDEEVCVFVTGKFDVLEGSVVNMPADDLSQVLSMQLSNDSVDLEKEGTCRVDLDTVYLTDSSYNINMSNIMENNMSEDNVILNTEDNASEETVTESSIEDAQVSEEVEAVSTDPAEVSTEDSETTASSEVDVVAEDTDDSSKDVEVVESTATSVELDGEFLAAIVSKLKELNIFAEVSNGNQEDSVEETEVVEAESSEEIESSNGASESGLHEEVATEDSKYSELKEDYANALRRVEELETRLVTVLSGLAEEKGKVFSEDQAVTLEVLSGWFDNMKEDSSKQVRKISKTVESPSVSSSDNGTSPTEDRSYLDGLGDYEKNVLRRYSDIIESNGKDAAERYLGSKKRYLPRGFHPSKLLES